MVHIKQDQTMLTRRREAMGPTYSLFYNEPVHAVRAERVWIYDDTGRRYLDAYNNVPIVGHCHPHVVDAITRQAGTLNTHTRYITDQPVQLAERLLGTMPAEIDNMVFTCSGSEANDLSVRVSKAATGNTGFIVTSYAYHGTTETIAGMSPATGLALGKDVVTVEAPLGAKGPAEFADRVRDAIALLRSRGVRPAGLMVDTNFSSDGVITDPAGFLAHAADAIRAAGGLFIADEVQPGFGRTGEAMWGFQRHGIVPDIVTMGKPMGNGHPIAAMAVRSGIMKAFASTAKYFNTFGGNTVACAASMAVLDVIESESLMANAATMGQRLRAGIEGLAERHGRISEIRGTGLFLGVQITGDDSKAETARIVNGLRDAGVLIGAAGRNVDVLKIRPPLPIRSAEIDLLIDSLGAVLAEA
ncbi:4-aminobutyrate aminotransferase [Sphingomonas sp. SRS2]|nr:4-aminobutyrate aminotransferase [Sphingomonas sp. SRS2]